MLTIRPARRTEAIHLTDLAIRSKAHWGYDEQFIAACRAELTTTPEEIDAQTVRVAVEAEDIPLGYYRLVPLPDGRLELGDLFVDPTRIGGGIGRALMCHAQSKTWIAGHPKLVIVSDPHAEGFYLRMGARRVGDEASGSIPGRRLPLLEIDTGPGDVSIEPMSGANRAACLALTVADDQRHFVPDVESSLTLAARYPDAQPLAIRSQGGVVGFSLYGIDETTGQWKIFRLLIDVAHQGRGYGTTAMRLIMDGLRDQHDAREILVVYHTDNATARRLYGQLGFVEFDRDGSKCLARAARTREED